MNQEVIPRGQGFDQNKVPAVEGYITWALHMEKSISPLFPALRGGGGRGCK